jgi:hypothetical protein
MCDSFQWLNICKNDSWVNRGGNLPRTRYIITSTVKLGYNEQLGTGRICSL